MYKCFLLQLKKLQEKAEKCRRDVEVSKDKYEAALNDINSYNAKYMEDMTEVRFSQLHFRYQVCS